MKKNNHYIFGNSFYSYNVEFWGNVLSLMIRSDICSDIKVVGRYSYKSDNMLTIRTLTLNMIIQDIALPISYRSIFTNTTIRHFNYYMAEYFGVQNAYKKLKQLLKNH